MRKILAMIDGSVYSQSVCDHVAWVAGNRSLRVELVHVLGRRSVPTAPIDLSGSLAIEGRQALLAELAELDAQNAKLAQKRGRLIVEAAKVALEEKGVSDVTTGLRQGDLVETVLDLESDVDLLVIGKRGEAADFAKMHLGSNLERVVRSSSIPVLVSSRAFKPIKRVLIAFDGRQTAMKAIDYIARTPLFMGLTCQVLMVGEESNAARKMLQDAQTLLSVKGVRDVSVQIRPGQPDKVIADAVERDQIDLLVMGAYSHSRLRALFIGSTTAEMIRGCLVPTLLFR